MDYNIDTDDLVVMIFEEDETKPVEMYWCLGRMHDGSTMEEAESYAKDASENGYNAVILSVAEFVGRRDG